MRKYSFALTDLLIILIVISMCIAATVVSKPRSEEPNGEVYYTLTVYGVGAEAENAIEASDVLTDEKGSPIGTVQQIISKESVLTFYDEKNFAFVNGYDYSKRDIDIKIFSKAHIGDGAYIVGETEICVGKTYKIHTSDFYAEGKCTSLQIRGEGE